MHSTVREYEGSLQKFSIIQMKLSSDSNNYKKYLLFIKNLLCATHCAGNITVYPPQRPWLYVLLLFSFYEVKIKHREVKKLAQDGTAGQVVTPDFIPKYNQFLLFIVVMFCRVTINTQ